MFHSRKLNNKINKLQERALRIVYNDYNSSFQTLLDKDNSVSVHDYNLQTLAIEMFKVYKGYSNEIENELFPRRNITRNLRYQEDFLVPKVNTVLNGDCSVSYLGPLIWNQVPDSFKSSIS